MSAADSSSRDGTVHRQMSEEDNSVLGSDGQGSRVDRDRRAPRFSWTPAYETTFFQSLCESVHLGLRDNSSFRAEAWERAAVALKRSHGASPTKSHLINKSDNARKRFRLWRGLREDPEFIYNPVTKTVSSSEEAWKAHIEREPLSRALRGRPFDHEEYMEVLYPDVIGSGGAPKRIMKPKRRTEGMPNEDTEMPGAGVLNLRSDSNASLEGLPIPHGSPTQPPRPSPKQSHNALSPTSGLKPRPTSTTIPPRSTASSTSALTPPDEVVGAGKKRPLSNGPPSAPLDSTDHAPNRNGALPPQSPGKRRRTSSRGASLPRVVPPPPPSASPSQIVPIMSNPPLPSISLVRLEELVSESRSMVGELLDVIRGRGASRWREEALDMFFKDFAHEDVELQVRICEGELSDEGKAMLFCKMPVRVRQHWMQKQREVYFRPSR